MMKSKELLSVIVPVYNTEKYLRKCIESILDQTYSPLEIILVDDGSTDSSGKICDFYAQNYENVSTIHMKNSGITSARLKGVEQSTGNRITFVDADDWIDPNYYLMSCDESNSDLIVTEIDSYYGEDHIIRHKLNYKEGFYYKDEILKEIIPTMLWDSELGRWAFDPSLCTKIFKREIILDELKKVRKIGSNYGEDSMVIFPLMFRIDKIKLINKSFYYHRQRQQGEVASYIKNDDFFIKLYKVYEYLMNTFKNEGHYEMMKTQLDNFYIQSVDLKKQCYKYLEYSFAVIFPFNKVARDSKVVLYGAGTLGRQYMEQNIKYNFCEIVLWVDEYSVCSVYSDYSVEKPEMIKHYEYDYIIIAIDNYYIAMDVRENLGKMNVPKNKIIWHSTRIIQN